jgi:hypothetical protein
VLAAPFSYRTANAIVERYLKSPALLAEPT